ncbi:MAG: HEAT repeat domain-containing protein [Treponema sp.]|jgi:hypothetical protein|nr:HEAT repeat domain-containing protein [Treponema sp.]
MLKKRTAVFCVMILAAAALVTGQQSSGDREMSVEESYLQESVELMVIREASQAGTRDQKMVALNYIGEAIGRGNRGEEIRQALEYLSMEGVMNKARENNRIVNNFPDVRRQAAKYLGDLGSPEAKNTLVRIIAADTEPMVLQEAVKSLAKIGINDNDETLNAIAWTFTRFDVTNPDNLLALSTVDAILTLAEKNGGIKDPNAIRTLIKISDGPYIKPVQEKARYAINELRKYNAQSQNR